MLIGHLGAALVARRIEPAVPLWVALLAAFWLDLIWPILLLAGVERVEVHPGDTAFTNLAFVHYPWTHGVIAVLGWSVLVAMLTRRFGLGPRAALMTGALVASHWVLDAIVHRPDLPLWNGGPLVGLGVWNSRGATFVLEGGLLLGAVWAHQRGFRFTTRAGVIAFMALLLLFLAMWVSQPWAPPPPSATAVAWSALALWLLGPWGRYLDRRLVAR